MRALAVALALLVGCVEPAPQGDDVAPDAGSNTPALNAKIKIEAVSAHITGGGYGANGVQVYAALSVSCDADAQVHLQLLWDLPGVATAPVDQDVTCNDFAVVSWFYPTDSPGQGSQTAVLQIIGDGAAISSPAPFLIPCGDASPQCDDPNVVEYNGQPFWSTCSNYSASFECWSE
jgi:hypothetical protein